MLRSVRNSPGMAALRKASSKKPRTAAQIALGKATRASNKEKLEGPAIRSIVDAGYPMPDRDYRFAKDETGRMWELDMAWPNVRLPMLYGLRLAFSIDGGGARGRHMSTPGYNEDIDKGNTALMLGWAVFRFTSKQLRAGEHLRILQQLWPLDK